MGEVEGAAVEPCRVAHFTLQDGGEGRGPVELAGGGGPEGLGVVNALAVKGFVGGERGDVSLSGELRGWREDAVLAEQRVHGVRFRTGVLGFGLGHWELSVGRPFREAGCDTSGNASEQEFKIHGLAGRCMARVGKLRGD